MTIRNLIIVFVALLFVPASTLTGCDGWIDVDDKDRDRILDTLDAKVSELTNSVKHLEAAFDSQRAKLAEDVQATLAVTVTNLRDLLSQVQKTVNAMRTSVTNLQQEFTADITGAMSQIRGTVDSLSKNLATTSAVAIQKLSAVLEEQRVALIHQTRDLVERTVRPTLERLSREGNFLVGKITREANTVIVRVVSGLIAIVALIGVIVVLVKLKQPGMRWLAFAATLSIFVGGMLSATVFAAPIASIGATPVKIPDPTKTCADMSDALAKFKEHESRETAATLKPLAVECQIMAPTAELAAQAEVAFRAVSVFEKVPLRCTSHADCAAEAKKCDIAIQACVDNWCDVPNDCDVGLNCDVGKHRCKPVDDVPCSSPADCRLDQSCSSASGHCVGSGTTGDCDTGAMGVCKAGKFVSEERWLKCKPVVQASPETCDGVDNNCNGTVDEGIERAEGCIAPNGVGECGAQGHYQCGGVAGWSCVAAAPQAETCDGKDNDCDGAADDGIPDGAPCPASHGECAKQARWKCTGGQTVCVPGAPTTEVCDGLDNNCDALADPAGTCGDVVIKQQSDSDNGKEMTWEAKLPTDLIDGTRVHGGPCGTDDHGRPYQRTRAEVNAASPHGATCSVVGEFNGFVSNDPTDCRIRVHYKTVRWGSNVWCSGTWWGTAVGPYLHN